MGKSRLTLKDFSCSHKYKTVNSFLINRGRDRMWIKTCVYCGDTKKVVG